MMDFLNDTEQNFYKLASQVKTLNVEGWCYLVNRYRRLGAQRVCELCPKSSVDADQPNDTSQCLTT